MDRTAKDDADTHAAGHLAAARERLWRHSCVAITVRGTELVKGLSPIAPAGVVS